MTLRWRSVVLAVVLITVLAVAMVWGLSLRLQAQLREQTLAQSQARAQQLADAMGGQVQAQLRQLDQSLRALRTQWLRAPEGLPDLVDQLMDELPPGMVTHASVVNAEGEVILDAPGDLVPRSMADRAHFQRLRDGPDLLLVGEPVMSRRLGRWVIAIGRPILRDGRFEGALYLLVSTDYFSRLLGRLTLANGDVVALLSADGHFLARSVDNVGAMGHKVPDDRPFMQDRDPLFGSFRERGALDGELRLFGWRRLPPMGTVVVVGHSEASVLAPVASAQRQALWLTTLLGVLLLVIGAWIVWLVWRIERGQADMLASREQLQEAQRTAHLGHWSLEADRGQMQWSDEVFRILGLRPGEIQPVYGRYWSQVHPDDRARLKTVFNQALTECTDVDEVHRLLRPDGSDRYVRLICHQEKSRLGRSFRGTLQDVTELRRTQLALQKLNQGLERRVRARTAELQALNRELESFTYSVAHDLRTPLRSIHGFATLLAETDEDRLSDEGKGFLRRIQDSARRMGLLITDLLSMAQHSRADIHPQWVDLSALAHQVIAELERAEPQRTVRCDIEPSLMVQADPTLMRVVLQNLLGNAWKYSGRRADAHISFKATGIEPDGQLGFCVQDNGAGFDMTYASQLFQPFKRLHAHHEFEGTGIGLATVAGVVQRHGGRVRAEGKVGEGACFSFCLPAEPLRQFADSDPVTVPR